MKLRVIECESGFLVEKRHLWLFWAITGRGPYASADEAIRVAKKNGFKRVVWP